VTYPGVDRAAGAARDGAYLDVPVIDVPAVLALGVAPAGTTSLRRTTHCA
jgi:hypothetical protein